MEDDLLVDVGAFFMLSCGLFSITKRRKPKRFGVRNFYRSRAENGHVSLMPKLRQDPEMHFKHFRMNAERFDKLLSIIGPHLKKHSFNTPLSPCQQLCITLRYLAAGVSMTSLTFEYRVSKATVSNTIKEVCPILWKQLQPTYLPVPTKEKWKQIAFDFNNLWNTPNCTGALDGKHIRIRWPSNSGPESSNFKKRFSIVLLATCDAHHCFTVVDVGRNDGINDEFVLNNSAFGQRLKSNLLDLPEPSKIPGTDIVVPYFFAADEAFPLSTNMMRPFPVKNLSYNELVYNYRLSRARVLIENTFGVLAAQWHIFHTPIHAKVETIENIVKATCILHNFLMMEDRGLPASCRQYCPSSLIDQETISGVHATVVEGDWRRLNVDQSLMPEVRRVGSNNYASDSAVIRNKLTEYFVSEQGTVPWQHMYVTHAITSN